MGIKEFNPYTPSRRFITIDDKEDITKEKPEKSLTETLKRTGGRNNNGRITSRFITGGHKKQYRIIDFRRDKKGVEGVVTAIEYDPNRNCRIALIKYKDGEKRYIIAPLGVNVTDKVMASETADIKAGNALPLRNMPDGTVVHNVEMIPGKGGQLARSAGAFAQIMGKEGDHVVLKMPSGELRKIRKDCYATIGQVGNLEYENIVIGKAGRSRWLGIRPATRAIVKNPCDHPMGGGEGKSKSGRHPVSPTNVKAKGFKTRNKKKQSSSLIITRKK